LQHFFHHFLGHGKIFQEAVDILHRSAAAVGNPTAATAVNQQVIGPLRLRH
jgi:hypothetical protein